MIEAVLDASAVLAVLRNEPGKEVVVAALSKAVLSSANAGEVVTRLVRDRIDPQGAAQAVLDFGCPIIPVDAGLGLRAGMLWRETPPRGLSLGDRICIALAEREGVAVLTADRAWQALTLPVEVRLIR